MAETTRSRPITSDRPGPRCSSTWPGPFFQWGKTSRPTLLRAAKDTASQEIAARPTIGTLARDLATLAPASIRRDAEQFAIRIGASR